VHVPISGVSELVGEPYFYDALEHACSSGRFGAVLDALGNAPGSSLLSELSVIPPAERDTLLEWAVAPPSTQCEEHTFSPLIHRYFEKVAHANPEFVAVHHANRSVTYGELDRWANALAIHLVQDLGVCPGDLVLQFFDKGIEMLVGILAVVSRSYLLQ
jgi:non-ribosomal peptide synthetase component F